jgi:hypothetical protein
MRTDDQEELLARLDDYFSRAVSPLSLRLASLFWLATCAAGWSLIALWFFSL